ncbi:MAG: malto-oligosyltrehalose trehalohydrolase [Bacillota bacterium]
MQMGAEILNREKSQIQFRVFAYNKNNVELLLRDGNGEKVVPMQEEKPHVYTAVVEGLGLEPLYKFRLGGEGDFPDPYASYLPDGVHGFSRVTDHAGYHWQADGWQGIALAKLIFYEIHTGTFSPQGTFQGIVAKLDYLQELGVNALELMPVTQTPGRWNWGYDGANLFSVNLNYGTPDDLKALVDECHQREISVFLDVVYNHFGPEGNYLPVFGPYFTEKYDTPWGTAVNYDDQFCEFMRQMVLDNVRYWLETYRFDGLRLDAVHAIRDESPTHILAEISRTARELGEKHGRHIAIIAETDKNDVQVINPPQKGGYGIDAQWMDDLHHCIHTALTGEKDGYYIDYGRLTDLEKVYKNYLFTGEHSLFWGKPRGTDASANPGRQFVVAIQNHDQTGNRAGGERLTHLVDFPLRKAAAGLLFFSPYLPLLFMGEEYGEQQPFLFFTDYTDPALKAAVSHGRREEFQAFDWADFPDPEDDQSFYRSKLTPREHWGKKNDYMFTFYRDLIRLKKTHPALLSPNKEKTDVKVHEERITVEITRWNGDKILTALFNLGKETLALEHYPGRQIMNSEWQQYGGMVEGDSAQLFQGNMLVIESSLVELE